MRKPEKQVTNRVNDEIRSKFVRIVNIRELFKPAENDPTEIQEVYSYEDALKLAEDHDTDLVEITVSNDTSICKLIDIDKFIYQEKKKAKIAKSNQKKSVQKEIKLGVDIAENDFKIKEDHARKFLQKGDYVKVTLQLKGRRLNSSAIRDNANILILKFVDDLSDVGKTSSVPAWQGNRLFVQINPK